MREYKIKLVKKKLLIDFTLKGMYNLYESGTGNTFIIIIGV